jgi:arsenate reductase
MMKIYEYKGCGTCRKALKFLETNGITYEKIPIRETPPSLKELKQVLSAVGDIRKLFNTSGGDYREMGLKDTLADMSESAQLKLLAANGNLIKRPFVVTQDGGWVGFKEDEWRQALGL